MSAIVTPALPTTIQLNPAVTPAALQANIQKLAAAKLAFEKKLAATTGTATKVVAKTVAPTPAVNDCVQRIKRLIAIGRITSVSVPGGDITAHCMKQVGPKTTPTVAGLGALGAWDTKKGLLGMGAVALAGLLVWKLR